MMEKGPMYSTENCIQYSMKNQDGKRKKNWQEEYSIIQRTKETQ